MVNHSLQRARGMTRIARKPLLVLLSLSIAILCCLSSPGTYWHLPKISSGNLFLHLLFNSIILVIVAKEHFAVYSGNELDKGFPLLHFVYEMEEHGGKMSSDDENEGYIDDLEGAADQANDDGHDNDDDDDKDDDDYGHGLDGYDEDDDDNGSYAEIGWEDDEEDEYDSELERRVDAFIAKVINGWREEWFSDNVQD